MNYTWLDRYCLALLGARRDEKMDWGVTRYLIDEKMFLMLGEDREKKEIITLKLPPAVGQLMRQDHAEVVPGYYMNKEHWNSIDANGSLPDALLKDMTRQSHALIFASLSKRRQKELLASPPTATEEECSHGL